MAIEGARPRPGGIAFTVRLTPKGGRDAINGWAADASGQAQLKARVSAPPENGKANAALIALLAKELGVPRRDTRIVSGETSRTKRVEIDGERSALMARLEGFGKAK